MLNSYIVFEHLTNDETTCDPPSSETLQQLTQMKTILCPVRKVLYVTD